MSMIIEKYEALVAKAEAGEWGDMENAALLKLQGGIVYESDIRWQLVKSFDGTENGALAPIFDYGTSIDAQDGMFRNAIKSVECLEEIDAPNNLLHIRWHARTNCSSGYGKTESLARLVACLKLEIYFRSLGKNS